ncbi:MAG: glucose dehydrogenase [Pseudohongiella sp.]|nr:MAG: glucose dehydrogenase [Pseudohongiella sp.]
MKPGQIISVMCCGLTSLVFAAESQPNAIEDPIPQRIQKGGISVVAQEFLRLPQTLDSSSVPLTNDAYARLQYMQPIPDGSGRLAINELRGVIYVYDEAANSLDAFLDIRDMGIGFDDSMFPNETGLAGFAFHPQFAQAGRPGYGKFYTAFSASSDSGVANYLDDNSENHESVIREWTATDASASIFAGTSREIFRIGQFAQNHNIGTLGFNYSASAADSDYGLLFASLGDGGSANDPDENGQSLVTPMSSIIRIDPLNYNNRSSYSIPLDNPFVDTVGAAPEIWAYGLRHPQHFSFDVDGTMYIADIGQSQIEEINIGIKGANYGWRVREGVFATAYGIGDVRPNPVYPRPMDDQDYSYPVLQFDHDEGNAVGSVFVYRGEAIPELVGKLVFSDMVTGRVFYAQSDGLQAGSPARIQELRIRLDGAEVNMADAVGIANTYGGGKRADLRLGIDAEGELFLITKADGWIRKLVAHRDSDE